MNRTAIISAALLCAGCSTVQQPTRMIAQRTADWRQVASGSDRARLRDWRDAFTGALAAARRAGHSDEISREGVLLDPDAALGGGPIANGTYRCRVVKLGAKSEGMLNYVTYPAFTCRIAAAGPVQDFAKITGSQRQVGVIFPGDLLRQVFLGTMALGDEQGAMPYGQDETRNVAGFVERIGPARWRIIMPRPHFESQLDVLELLPGQD